MREIGLNMSYWFLFWPSYGNFKGNNNNVAAVRALSTLDNWQLLVLLSSVTHKPVEFNLELVENWFEMTPNRMLRAYLIC